MNKANRSTLNDEQYYPYDAEYDHPYYAEWRDDTKVQVRLFNTYIILK